MEETVEQRLERIKQAACKMYEIIKTEGIGTAQKAWGTASDIVYEERNRAGLTGQALRPSLPNVGLGTDEYPF